MKKILLLTIIMFLYLLILVYYIYETRNVHLIDETMIQDTTPVSENNKELICYFIMIKFEVSSIQ